MREETSSSISDADILLTTMDSPPHDSILTLDRILRRSPQAPMRPRKQQQVQPAVCCRPTPCVSETRNDDDHDDDDDEEEEYNHMILNNRSSEAKSANRNDSKKECMDLSNTICKTKTIEVDTNKKTDDDGDDDDDDDTEMVRLHRLILPSRKLFDDDDEDEDVRKGKSENMDFYLDKFLTDHAQQHLKFPVLFDNNDDVDQEDYTNIRQRKRTIVVSDDDYQQHQQQRTYPFGNHPLPLFQRFEPVFFADDVFDDVDDEYSTNTPLSSDEETFIDIAGQSIFRERIDW